MTTNFLDKYIKYKLKYKKQLGGMTHPINPVTQINLEKIVKITEEIEKVRRMIGAFCISFNRSDNPSIRRILIILDDFIKNINPNIQQLNTSPDKDLYIQKLQDINIESIIREINNIDTTSLRDKESINEHIITISSQLSMIYNLISELA
jgi:hypothetical protein